MIGFIIVIFTQNKRHIETIRGPSINGFKRSYSNSNYKDKLNDYIYYTTHKVTNTYSPKNRQSQQAIHP